VLSHLKYVGLVHPIQHEEKPQEYICKGTMSYEEFLLKIKEKRKKKKQDY
jgi:hypothetical protein